MMFDPDHRRSSDAVRLDGDCCPFRRCKPGALSRAAERRDDARTCASFGAELGTTAYSNCVLEQRRRGHLDQRDTLTEMALTSRIANNGQIVA